MKIENEIDPTETTHRFRELQQQVGERARNVSRVTDEFVHENTWTTVAVAAVIGCLIGYFLRPGAHDVTLEDWQAMVAFADRHLR